MSHVKTLQAGDHKPHLAAALQSWDRRIIGRLPPDHQVKRFASLTALHS